ncbi:MAG: glycine--tRNA ligase subunit beta, partial [Gammaproteobacteria bacterium]|nr:glycine--tRNA ligase subunit beta [Gammaproteobacteria bacterium]
MSKKHDLLIEIGTEELPSGGLENLAQAFNEQICAELEKCGLDFSSGHAFATPRRLAVLVRDLVEVQPDRTETRRGPALDKAFDKNGKPGKAALGFADSCGVPVDQLETIETGKGKWLGITREIPGARTADLLQSVAENALAAVPVRKRLRWGDHGFDFVRPVHWIAAVFGKETVSLQLLGTESGNTTCGHRFMAPETLVITNAADYPSLLKDKGKVIADFNERKSIITEQVNRLAGKLNGQVLENEQLLNEVTGLVEWPVALSGGFDTNFLELPREVLIATMEKHQKSFAIQDEEKNLLPYFIAVSNLESRDPDQVVRGNEKVLHPRLSDADFFYRRDLTKPLADHGDRLASVMYQESLGSLADRTNR